MNWNEIKQSDNWRPVIGYEDKYLVSKRGEIYSTRNNKILRQTLATNGYKFVMLSKQNKPQSKRVHRLVAEAFIPNPNKKSDVNHINSDRTNNNLENLEWVTRSENLRHCVETTDKIDGENNYRSIFDRWQVIIIRYLWYGKKYEGKQIAKIFNTAQNNIFQVCSYKRYKKILHNKVSKEELSGCLFRFFDEQGIIIETTSFVSCEDDNTTPRISFLEEIYVTDKKQNGMLSLFKLDKRVSKTRIEAEQAAFGKAFLLLESKLCLQN